MNREEIIENYRQINLDGLSQDDAHFVENSVADYVIAQRKQAVLEVAEKIWDMTGRYGLSSNPSDYIKGINDIFEYCDKLISEANTTAESTGKEGVKE